MSSSSLHAVRRELVSTAFRQLGEGASRFAIDHLPELISEHKDLDDLGTAIASLAVRGGLSDSHETDDDVDDLLDSLAKGKQTMAGSFSRRRSIATTSSIETLGYIPETWRWVP